MWRNQNPSNIDGENVYVASLGKLKMLSVRIVYELVIPFLNIAGLDLFWTNDLFGPILFT